MSESKQEALDLLDTLHPTMDYADYLTLHDGLNDIDTIEERDQRLEELWAMFADVPMDPETELMEAPFLGFPAGTGREDIWHWFDERYSKGVAALLYDGEGRKESEISKLYHLKQSCIECESDDCGFNRNGWCRFPMVHERQPEITDRDGCIEYCLKEDIWHGDNPGVQR